VGLLKEMESEVLFDVNDGIGIITLNKPKTLNALTMNMISQMRSNFSVWTLQDDIKAIIIKGAGDKAFCAGGDVRAVRQSIIDYDGLENSELVQSFFYEEYILNHQIHKCQKPHIAIIDRVCMGGGLGLSVHGSFRVATERTLVGMPETAIGLFPDVGGSWFLSRLSGEIGTYLGLTGRPVHAGDCLALGIATHLVESSSLKELETELCSTTFGMDAFSGVEKVLNKFSISSLDTPILNLQTQIDSCFSTNSVEEIIFRLKEDKTNFGLETLNVLETKSPTSLKVTLEQIRRGSTALEFGETLTMEFRMAQHFARGNDFPEGVRALLVDKDHKPKWYPNSLEDVSVTDVAEYFESVPWRELKFS
jgi:enoyl-CoA hydratase